MISAEVEEWMETYLAFRLPGYHPRLLEWQGSEQTGAILERSLRRERSLKVW